MVPGALPRRAATGSVSGLGEVPTLALVRELCARLGDRGALGDFDQDLGVAQVLLDRLGPALDRHTNRYAPRFVASLFERLYGAVAADLPPLRGLRVAEVGCGSLAPLNLGMVFLLLGARRAIGIDLDAVQDVPRAVRALADVVCWMLVDPTRVVGPCAIPRQEMLANVASFDLAGLAAGNPEALDRDRIRFHQESVAAMRSVGDGELDLLLSNSFLEHIDDVDGAIAEMRRVVRPGGFVSHGIDATDHRRYGDPAIGELTYLKEPGGEGMVHGTNRIRPVSFVPRFERHGFALVRFRPIHGCRVTDEEIRAFGEPFRSMPRADLELTMAHVLLRRL